MTSASEVTRLPNCRLFLVVPVGVAPERARLLVEKALSAGDVASLLLSSGPEQLEMAKQLKPISHAHDTALLIEGDAHGARRAGADGVHVQASPSAYSEARALLGKDAIIGADCGSSRHLAMTMGELGADYIAFSGLLPARPGSIIGWWSELFEQPGVALDPAGEEDARVFIAEGADFIRPADAMWRDADSAAAAVRSFNSFIGENS
jgi:thiamine-phosphate pyrophosphorylase